MLNMYQRAGREAGYWGNYFVRSVKTNGGLATAKRMLLPLKTSGITAGLQALVDAGRPDLSLEAVVLQNRFAPLFTPQELREAQRRLNKYFKTPRRKPVEPEKNFPDTLPNNHQYFEGGVRKIKVNAYERDSRARKACIHKYGLRCAACGLRFEERYGGIGKGFIHVHHKKPLAIRRRKYKLDPLKDLIPVCPNCHSMLHTSDPPLSIQELKRHLRA